MRMRALLVVLIALALTAPGWAATKSKTKAKAKAKPAAKVAVKKTPPVVVKQSLHFTINSSLPQPYMESVLKVGETALDGYRDVFGLSLYPNPNPGDKRMVLNVMAKPRTFAVRSRWEQKPAQIDVTMPSEGTKEPGGSLDALTVSGMIRQLAYPVAAFDNGTFNAGLMDYLGMHVVDYVAEKFDAGKLARADNWVELGGTGGFSRWEQTAEPGSEAAAAVLLYRVANAHGKDTVGKALRLVAMSQEPTWQAGAGAGVHPRIYKVAALCQQLVDMTGDGEIAQWFRENRFPSIVDPMNVTAAELWGQKDEVTRCQFLCERWGGNGVGLLDGKQVVLLGRFDEQKHPAAVQQQKSVTVEGVVLEAVPGTVTSVWFQPETKRIYVAGKVKLVSGATVENGTIDVPAAPAPPVEPAAPAQ